MPFLLFVQCGASSLEPRHLSCIVSFSVGLSALIFLGTQSPGLRGLSARLPRADFLRHFQRLLPFQGCFFLELPIGFDISNAAISIARESETAALRCFSTFIGNRIFAKACLHSGCYLILPVVFLMLSTSA